MAIVHINYVIEGSGALVNEKGEEQPLKAGDFALVNPDEKHQYRNRGNKPFKMIAGCRRSLNKNHSDPELEFRNFGYGRS